MNLYSINSKKIGEQAKPSFLLSPGALDRSKSKIDMSLIFLPNDNEMKENLKNKIFCDQYQGKQIEKLNKTNEKARQAFF